MAIEAFKEAINLATPLERKRKIEHQLLDYCKLDTYSMVRMWSIFRGSNLSESHLSH